jgi:hypothetical protein
MRDDVGLAAGGDASVSRGLGSREELVPEPRAGRRARPRAVVWAPLLCAAVYAGAVLANLHTLLAAVYVDSDAALAPVLGQAIGHIPAGAYVSLGNHAWYEEWLFLTITRDAPAHRQLWEIAPLLWSLCGLVMLLASVRGVLGRGAAALCGAALVCVGPFGRFCFLAINWHSLSAVHTVLAASIAVWLLPRLQALSRTRLVAAASGLGLLCALPSASDTLFVAWAMVPLLLAIAALAMRAGAPRRRLALVAAIVSAVTALGAVLIAAAMRHAGVTARALPVAAASISSIPHNLVLLAESFVFVAGGALALPSLHALDVVRLLSAVLALAGVAAAANEARIVLAATLSGRAGAARAVYGVFWSSCVLASALAFVLTTAPKDALSGRYLLAAYVASAALLALAAARGPRARRWLALGVCLFAVLAVCQLLARPFVAMGTPGVSDHFPGPATAAALERFARAERVEVGYGGYWDAEDLTWNTDFRVLIRPVRPCSVRHLVTLCYPQLGDVSSWYTPRRDVRSLLLVDRPGVSYDVIKKPPATLGPPIARARVGYLEAYVYPYDIAARLQRPRCGFSWAHPC